MTARTSALSGNTPRLAVFDCDGTLVDGQAAICEAMEAAFRAAELPIPQRTEIRRIVGLSLPQAVALLAAGSHPDQQARAVEAYKQSYRLSRNDGRLCEPLFDGIATLLADLRTDGWTLGVATGKSARGLRLCLQEHALSDLFVTLQTADHHPSKPDPSMLRAAMAEAGVEPAQTVMIGDTSFDMTMAQSCDVRGIGVSWGYHDDGELLEAGASFVTRTVAELRAELLA